MRQTEERLSSRLLLGRGAPLGAQLAAVFAICVALVSVLVGESALSDFHAARSAAVDEVVREASTQATSVNSYLASGVEQSLATITHQPGVRSNAPDRCSAGLHAVAQLADSARLEVDFRTLDYRLQTVTSGIADAFTFDLAEGHADAAGSQAPSDAPL